MREIYEKSELRFALIWIGIYVVLMSVADGVSETISAAKIVTAPICAGLVLAMYLWIRRNGLKEKYGLREARSSICFSSLWCCWRPPISGGASG